MNKRQLSAVETKQKLLNACIELLKEKGLTSTNVEEITKKAGVAKGSFYTYFKRKEDIVLETCRMPFKEIADNIQTMQNADLIKKLTRYFHRFMACIEGYGLNITREWIKDVINPNDVINNQDGEKWAYDFETLKKILDDAIKNKELKKDTPTELLAHLIISQLYGMMTCWCMSDSKFKPTDWTEKFCKIQLGTILKDYLI